VLTLLARDGANLIAVLVVAELRGGAYDKRILNVVDSQRGVVVGGVANAFAKSELSKVIGPDIVVGGRGSGK
jgi:hypothetical protein